MVRVRVIYHDDSPHCWWAESPDIPRWTAAAASHDELRTLVEEGVRFALERDDVTVEHLVASLDAAAPQHAA